MCTHVYTSHRHYYSSLLSTHLPFFLAGWLNPTLPDPSQHTKAFGFEKVELITIINITRKGEFKKPLNTQRTVWEPKPTYFNTYEDHFNVTTLKGQKRKIFVLGFFLTGLLHIGPRFRGQNNFDFCFIFAKLLEFSLIRRYMQAIINNQDLRNYKGDFRFPLQHTRRFKITANLRWKSALQQSVHFESSLQTKSAILNLRCSKQMLCNKATAQNQISNFHGCCLC